MGRSRAKMDPNTDIDAWKRVHSKLTLALIQSCDNITAEMTKRRYLLEEMNRCKMQNTPKLASYSAKKRNLPPIKVVPTKNERKIRTASSSTAVGKEKSLPSAIPVPVPRKASSKIGEQPKFKDNKNDGAVTKSILASKVVVPRRTPAAGVESESLSPNKRKITAQDNGNARDPKGGEMLRPKQQLAGITPPMYYPSVPYGVYGNINRTIGMDMATSQQMELAFQMMQQINQNQNVDTDKGKDDDKEDT